MSERPMPDLDRLEAALGRLSVDDRIDLPLEEQVELLVQWACSAKPDGFRRSVPVSAKDHDILITHTLRKLVSLLRETTDA